jgi:hypothetical protein
MVLYPLETDHFYELNGTAARFWELLYERTGADQIHEQMIAEFAVDPVNFANEAEVLLNALRNEDLVFVDG